MAEIKNKQELELLAPAGSYETFCAVLRAGADAVYLGGSQFGARAYANNFTKDELLRAIDEAHIHDRAVYLTVNTLFKEKELEEQLCEYLRPYYLQGLDAVIVQDIGALSLIRREFPDMDIHTSTQMTVTGAYGASYMKELGASRIVTAREMSIAEIRRIHEEVDIEIETFVHGALCYCYSGQCLLSSMLGGRSGNRGRCAQPCRLPYEVYDAKRNRISTKGDFVLSPKDLCGIEHIPALFESGVYSLKIEGRMKQAEYAAGVVSVYRRYTDCYLDALQEARAKGLSEEAALDAARAQYQVAPSDKAKLFDMGNRSGFTDGYYSKNNGSDMITFGKPNHAKTNERLQEEIRERYVHAKAEDSEIKEKINGILRLKKELPASIEVTCKHTHICVSGDIVQAARSQPLSLEKVETALRKTGHTPFIFEELTIEMEDDIFLPVQAIKQLRRTAIEQLETAMLTDRRRDSNRKAAGVCDNMQRSIDDESAETYIVSVETREQAHAALRSSFVNAIYYDSCCYDNTKLYTQLCADVTATHAAGKQAYFILPAIFRERTAIFYQTHLSELFFTGIDGIVVKSYDALAFVKEQLADKMEVILDSSIYLWNTRAKQQLWENMPLRDTIPFELNRRELACRDNRCSEMLIYGYLPLMTSAQCVHANTKCCDKHKTVTYLKDRYGKYFPVKNHCGACYNTIYNTTPVVLFGVHEDLKDMGVTAYRISFTVEEEAQAARVLLACEEAFLHGRRDFKELLVGDYTNGHFKRGVE